MMGKNKGNVDERTVMETQKICTQAYYIVLGLLSVSFFIKLHIFDMPFKDIMTDLIIILIGSGYVMIRMILKGTGQVGMVEGKNKKKRIHQMLGASVVFGLVMSVAIGCINFVKYGFDPKALPGIIGILFIQFAILMFVGIYLIDKLSTKVAHKQIEEDEEE